MMDEIRLGFIEQMIVNDSEFNSPVTHHWHEKKSQALRDLVIEVRRLKKEGRKSLAIIVNGMMDHDARCESLKSQPTSFCDCEAGPYNATQERISELENEVLDLHGVLVKMERMSRNAALKAINKVFGVIDEYAGVKALPNSPQEAPRNPGDFLKSCEDAETESGFQTPLSCGGTLKRENDSQGGREELLPLIVRGRSWPRKDSSDPVEKSFYDLVNIPKKDSKNSDNEKDTKTN